MAKKKEPDKDRGPAKAQAQKEADAPKSMDSARLDTRNDEAKPKKSEAYIVEFLGDFNGEKYYVRFCHGTGVLDTKAILFKNSEWFRPDANGNLVQYRGETIHQYAEYFWKKGATVRPVNQKEADEMRYRIENNPNSLLKDLDKRFPNAADKESKTIEEAVNPPPVEPEETEEGEGEKEPPKMPHEE